MTVLAALVFAYCLTYLIFKLAIWLSNYLTPKKRTDGN